MTGTRSERAARLRAEASAASDAVLRVSHSLTAASVLLKADPASLVDADALHGLAIELARLSGRLSMAVTLAGGRKGGEPL